MSGKKEYPKRSRKKMTYHGRSGYPIIHKNWDGKKFMMVRKRGGGTKKMFLDKNGNVPKKYRHKK